MLDLIVYAILFGIIFGLLYGIYRIPPVRRWARKFADKHREGLITLAFGLFVAAALYFIILPRL